MSLNVVILRSAEADLRQLKSYLVKDFGVATWRTSYGKLKEAIRNIGRYPEFGKVPRELENLGAGNYRQVISGANRIIYEVKGDTAYIHIICDARRDLRTVLATRLLRPM